MNKAIFSKTVLVFLTLLINFITFSQTVDEPEGCAPHTANFTAPAGLTSWVWDFGNGSNSSLENPGATYSTPGNYTVELKETIDGPIIYTVGIEIYEKPTLGLVTTDTEGCSPFNATITDSTIINTNIGISSYTWAFGDGTGTTSTTGSISHTYTGTNNTIDAFDVTLQITTDLSSCDVRASTFEDHIKVIDAPSPSFTTNPTSLLACEAPFDVVFTNTSTGIGSYNLNYEWSFGNSETSTSETPPSQTYTTDGAYNIKLETSYDFGCAVSTTKTVSIGSPDAVINRNFDVDCSNNTVVISTPVSGARYEWYVNNNLQSQSQSFIPNTTIGDNDIKLILTSSDGQCSDSATTTLVKDDLDVTLTSLTGYSCEFTETFDYEATTNQDDASIKWTFIDGSTLEDDLTAQYTHSLPSFTSTIYYPFTRVTASNDAGCEVSKTVVDTLSNPKAYHFVLDNEGGCTPLTTTFQDSSFIDGAFTKTVLLGNGETIPISTYANYVYTTGGDFETRVVIENDKGCSDTSDVIIVKVGDSVSIEPDFDILEPLKLCYHENISIQNLTDTDLSYNYTYDPLLIFFPIPGIKDNVTSHPVENARDITEIKQVITYNGCTFNSTKTQQIDVDGSFAITGTELDCDLPLIRNFSSSPFSIADTVSWSINNVYETSDISFTKDFGTEGIYEIMLITNNDEGCKPDTNITFVEAVILDIGIDVPNLTQCINTRNNFNAIDINNVVSKFFWEIKTPTTLDTATSNGIDTTFSFDESGIHTAYVTVSDVNECIDTDSVDFKVFDIRPTVTSDISEICNPDTVGFTNTSTGDTTLTGWRFNFADGSDTTFTTEPTNWSHIYLLEPTTGDNYITSINVTDILGCNETGIETILRYAPKTEILVGDSTLCAGDSITISPEEIFSNVGELDFYWDLGVNGISTSTTNTITYLTAGAKEIKLFVSEPSSGCAGEDTITATINVQEYPTADFSTNVDDVALYCAPLLTQFTDNSTGSITSQAWDFGDNQTNSNVKNPFIAFQEGVSLTEYIVYTSFGCSDTTTRIFDVKDTKGDFTRDKTGIICQEEDITFNLIDTVDIVNYTWDFGDGRIDSNSSPITHQYVDYPQSNFFTVTLTLQGQSGCDVDIQKEVVIDNVIAEFTIASGDTAQCFEENKTITIQNQSVNADNYLWDYDNNLTDNTAGNKTTLYNSPGTYDIKLFVTSNTSDCEDEIIKQFTFYDLPQVDAIGDTVCEGNEPTIFINNPNTTYNYVWSPTTGLEDPLALVTTASIDITTSYISTATDTNGCVGTDTAIAFVINPSSMSDFDTTIVVGDSAKLPAYDSDFRNFTWTPTIDLSCLQCDYPYSTTLETITYNLNVDDNYGCYNDNYEFTVNVRPETFIRMPTTFSPNEDGVNDIVFVKGWGIKELISFEIYNRWGELLYTSTDIEEGWDGTYKGDIQNSDAYAYKVTVIDWRDEEIRTEGYLNLIH